MTDQRFTVHAIDHLVLCVVDVARTRAFYADVLGMAAREERPGKWSMHAGDQKISLQDASTSPSIARDTVPGSGNFCLLSETPVSEWLDHFSVHGVEVVDGPGQRAGATGPIWSVYVRDPDGNLVEVSNRLD